MFDIEAFLRQHDVWFERTNHPAVFTCEEADKLVPPLPGAKTKNLLLRDRKGTRTFLVVVGYDKSVDLKGLRDAIGADKLSFASPERMKEILGVEPGSVTILGIANDTEHKVEVFLDDAIWAAEAIQCHPLVNTATLVIPHAGLEGFLKATGHAWKVLNVPSRNSTEEMPEVRH